MRMDGAGGGSLPRHTKRTQTGERSNIVRDPNAAGRAITALELAMQGLPYREIARRAGYSSVSGAFNAVQRELQRTMQHKCDDLRTLEGQRLDALLAAMWLHATDENAEDATWFVDRCLAIMERRAKLFGLDIKDDAVTAQPYTKRVTLHRAPAVQQEEASA